MRLLLFRPGVTVNKFGLPVQTEILNIFCQKSFIMPLENFEEEGLAKIPNLELAQQKFLLTTDRFRDDPKIKNTLFQAIKADSKFSCNLSLITHVLL